MTSSFGNEPLSNIFEEPNDLDSIRNLSKELVKKNVFTSRALVDLLISKNKIFRLQYSVRKMKLLAFK